MSAKRSAVPRRPDRAYFECFALVLSPDTGPRQRGLARRLGATLDRGWTVRQLGSRSVPDRKRVEREVLLVPPQGTWIPVPEAWDLAAELNHHHGVRNVEPLFVVPGLEPSPRHLRTLLTPSELRDRSPRRAKAAGIGSSKPKPCAKQPDWSIEAIRAQKAWAIASPNGKQYGDGIVIGHLDTGYTDHPELWDPAPAPQRVLVAQGFDFQASDPDPRDPLDGSAPGHGTSTASVIMSALRGPDPIFVSGVAPRASLVPVRVSGGVVHVSFQNVVEGIHHCVDKGVHVISMSLGGPVPSSALERAVDRAVDAGVIVLAAAGNVWPFVVYPARLPHVIAVAATNCDRRPWSNSASGEAVDVAAPGESVWRASAERRKGKAVFDVAPSSGTSYAVANAAGACALWLAFHGRDALITRYGASNVARVFAKLLADACETPPGWNARRYGRGIIDAERLLLQRLPPTAAGVAAKVSKRKAPATRKLLRRAPGGPDARVVEAELHFHAAIDPRWRAALGHARSRPADLAELVDSEGSYALAKSIASPTRRAGARRARNRRN